jgi:curved DNA-binding protein
MFDHKDYYEVMGVARDATPEEIKRAYRKLARRYHPDISDEKDAETHFKEIGEAYEVLRDPERRAAYDQLGGDLTGEESYRSPGGWDSGFPFGAPEGQAASFSDFFESVFRSSQSATAEAIQQKTFHVRGQDHHAKVLIDLEDSLHGATRRMTLRIPDITGNGELLAREHQVTVRIPRGIRPGQEIRLTGEGGPGSGSMPPGDLYLAVEFKPHRYYRVDGVDLYVNVPVAPWELALGATVKVPTPDGLSDLKLPTGLSTGRTFRLKGRGIPAASPGNLYAVLRLVLPPADTDETREFYRRMAKELGFDPRANLWS